MNQNYTLTLSVLGQLGLPGDTGFRQLIISNIPINKYQSLVDGRLVEIDSIPVSHYQITGSDDKIVS